MSTRDELARIIEQEYTRAIDRRRASDCFTAPADAILASGYRKPRTIATYEDLDALPDGAVILDAEGYVGKRVRREDDGDYWLFAGVDWTSDSDNVILPATVLHESAVEA